MKVSYFSPLAGLLKKIELYLEYYPVISELEQAWKEKLPLFLESLKQKLELEKRNWPEPNSWVIEVDGQRMYAHKDWWFPDDGKGVYFYFYPRRSKQGFKLEFYVGSHIRSHFNPKFEKLFEENFKNQKLIGNGNFEKYKGEAYIFGCLIKINFGMGGNL